MAISPMQKSRRAAKKRTRNGILDIKTTFHDMHPRTDVKRGIMQIGTMETMRDDGGKAPIAAAEERTAL